MRIFTAFLVCVSILISPFWSSMDGNSAVAQGCYEAGEDYCHWCADYIDYWLDEYCFLWCVEKLVIYGNCQQYVWCVGCWASPGPSCSDLCT